MKITITRRFEFAAAHHLNGLREWHKCARNHGHNYNVDVSVEGPLDENGMVLDAELVDAAVGPIVKDLDHHDLNEIMPQPTAENIALFLFQRVAPLIPTPCRLVAVTVGENGRLAAEVSL
jgi:6-pyruvoyltetrahydropterin/6-carboxytetrahydropterin synthase